MSAYAIRITRRNGTDSGWEDVLIEPRDFDAFFSSASYKEAVGPVPKPAPAGLTTPLTETPEQTRMRLDNAMSPTKENVAHRKNREAIARREADERGVPLGGPEQRANDLPAASGGPVEGKIGPFGGVGSKAPEQPRPATVSQPAMTGAGVRTPIAQPQTTSEKKTPTSGPGDHSIRKDEPSNKS